MATSNFRTQDDFPLFATTIFDPYEYEDEDTGETLYSDGDAWLFRYCQKQIDELNATLEFYELRLEDGHYSGVQTFLERRERGGCAVPLSEDYTAKEWREMRAEARKYPGSYYSWEFSRPYSEQVRAEQREREKIINFCKTVLNREFAFDEYAVSARFSNGETWYTKVAA